MNREEIFAQLKQRYPKAIALHELNQNWPNVLDHCLIEAARADIFAKLLGFSAELRDDLVTASLVHDAYKRQEVEAIKAESSIGGTGMEAEIRANDTALAQLAEQKFSDRVIRLVGLVGGGAPVVLEIQRIIDQEAHTEEELAALVVHYIDNYTRDSDPVTPAIQESGIWINDIDRRARANMAKQQYAGIDTEWKKQYAHDQRFAGKNSFEVMVMVSRKIENVLMNHLSHAVTQNSGVVQLPELIERSLAQ